MNTAENWKLEPSSKKHELFEPALELLRVEAYLSGNGEVRAFIRGMLDQALDPLLVNATPYTTIAIWRTQLVAPMATDMWRTTVMSLAAVR